MRHLNFAGVVCSFGLLGVSAAQAGDVFALDLRAAPNRLLQFPSNAPANNAIASVTPDSFAMDFDAAGTTLYVVTPGATPFNIGTLNTTTGAVTPGSAITGLLAGEGVTGLKYDPQTTQYYLSVFGNAVSRLYTLDVNTGVASNAVSMGAPLIIDIAIDINGQMYGHDIGADTLLSINKNTGTTTTIGPTGQLANFAQGMDFDYSDGNLYATIYTGGGTGVYASFNLTTGAANVITSTTPWNSEMEMAVNSPVPEPATLVLLGLSALLLRRR